MTSKEIWLRALDVPGWRASKHTIANDSIGMVLWVGDIFLECQAYEKYGPYLPLLSRWEVRRKAIAVTHKYWSDTVDNATKAGEK